MVIEYIRENKEAKLAYKVFNIFKVEKIDEKTIINIPVNQYTRIRKIEQNALKLSKYLYNNNIKNVVLSTELFRLEPLKNILYSNNINILDGKKLSRFLTYNIIQKIFDYKKIGIEVAEITILVNNNDDINIKNIMKIAQNIKRLNIITAEPRKFRKLVEYLYDELGILIKLSNNLKTNLKSSNIILNMDFPEEWVNQLNISCDAIIASIPNEIKISSKRFAGINIKNWNIEIPNKYKFNGFEDNLLYEATLYNKRTDEIYNQISIDEIKIKNLLGINGVINRTEFI